MKVKTADSITRSPYPDDFKLKKMINKRLKKLYWKHVIGHVFSSTQWMEINVI